MNARIIPEEALHQHIIVLGKTRSGKSSTMRGMVERLLDDGKPVCILDPKGDWWGLKSSADGKRAGYPVVIFGGSHADIPLNAHAGAHVAELVATGNRPCIIDLGGWMVSERTRFFIDFASTLFRLTRGARWLVIDEVHNFCPQGKVMDPDAGKMLHWANRLASEGLGKGLQIIAASQRPQKVHKDFVTSCETLIAMRVIHPLDRGAIKEWIDGCPDPEKGKEVLNSLASMPRGTGWVWSPEIGFGPKRVAFPMFSTYDSFKPQHGEAVAKLKGWAEVDLEDVKAKLGAVVEEAAKNDPKLLRQRIAELERDAKKMPAASTIDPQAVEQAEQSGYMRGKIEGYREGLAAFPRDPLARIDRLLDDFSTSVKEFSRDVEAWQARQPDVQAVPRRQQTVAPAPVVKHSVQFAKKRNLASSGVSLPIGERATLIACAQHDGGCTREQLSILTGYKRSSRDAYIQRLREKGYLETGPDRITATDAGVDALGADFEPLPTGTALREYWLGRLPEGEKRVLQILVDAYPSTVARADIDQATGYQRSSSDAYIQRLKARQLVTIQGRGEVRANDQLF